MPEGTVFPPPNTDIRCEEYLTEPGIIYHAHTLRRCQKDAIGIFDGRFYCEDHWPAP